jgi:polar amino acid transport system substrate-binding protein
MPSTPGRLMIGRIGTERQRAERIALSATYAEIEATYVVPPVTPIASLAEVDRAGVWIASTAEGAYDLCLLGTFVRPP